MNVAAPPSAETDAADLEPSPVASRPIDRRWLGELALVAVAVAAGIALRGLAASDLWRDEALTVNIAKLSPHGIFDALGHDGHPPLYYLLLHGWMKVFGQSDTAVRALSGVISVATLPLVYHLGRKIGGRRCAIAALVLMATSPQAVRYATETRMYALVVLLAMLGWLALRASLERPTLPNLAGVTACTAALLLTHYWSAYLLTGTGSLLLWGAWRGRVDHRIAARRAVVAVVIGGILFLPWLPVFIDQIRSTGAPWAAPARPALVLSSLLIGTDPAGEDTLLGMALLLLIALAIFGRPVDDHRVELDLRTQRDVRSEFALMVLVLVLAVTGGYVSAVAFAPRYTAVVFPIAIVLAAMGVARLPSRPVRMAALGGVALLGLVASLHVTRVSRTQLGDVGRALRSGAHPGDLVVYCPDQLAPTVLRYSGAGHADLTYPQTPTPERINWIDYQYRVDSVAPDAFAVVADARARGRAVWLVWSENFTMLGRRCENLVAKLGDLRPHHEIVITPQGAGGEPQEHAWLYRFDPR